MAFRKILSPIDFSPGSARAAAVAARLAAESGAELVLAHVWSVPPEAGVQAHRAPPELEQSRHEARGRLDAAERAATEAGARRVTSKLLTGPAWETIVGELRESTYDLVVVGTQGRTGLTRILLGSVAEQVVRHAPCAVLVVRPDSEPRPFTHVLCPVDFSEGSQRALQLAAELVRPGGAGITLLHVLEVPVAYAGELPDPRFLRDLDTTSAKLLDECAAQLARRVSVPVTTRSRIGWPGAGVLAALDTDPTVELVVMGSHGRTGLSRAVLGSVAEKVTRHAPCPVLVARGGLEPDRPSRPEETGA